MTYPIAGCAFLRLAWCAVVIMALLCIIRALEDLEGCKEMVDAIEAFERDSCGGDWWDADEWEWEEEWDGSGGA